MSPLNYLPWPLYLFLGLLELVAAYLVCLPEPWYVFFGMLSTKSLPERDFRMGISLLPPFVS